MNFTCTNCKKKFDVDLENLGKFEKYGECLDCNILNVQNRIGVPIRYRNAKLTDFESAFAVLLGQMSVNGGLIWGLRGIGKSHAIWACVNHRIEKSGYSPRVYSWSSLILRQRACFQPGATEAEDDIAKELVGSRFLILDDVCDSTVQLTSSTTTFIVNVVDERYNKNLKTLWSSNFSPAPGNELHEKLGGKVVDRLLHGSRAIELTGKNRRLL